MSSITHSPEKINNEIWKDIPGYVGFYQVSNCGRVRSCNRITRHKRKLVGKPLRQKMTSQGYCEVTLQKDGSAKTIRVHKVVMLAFVGKRPKGHDIHHIDNNKSNNHLGNLVYILNQVHQLTIDRPKGTRNGNSKVTPVTVKKIRKLYKAKALSQRDIAKLFEIHQGTVHQIVTRKTWNHIE